MRRPRKVARRGLSKISDCETAGRGRVLPTLTGAGRILLLESLESEVSTRTLGWGSGVVWKSGSSLRASALLQTVACKSLHLGGQGGTEGRRPHPMVLPCCIVLLGKKGKA